MREKIVVPVLLIEFNTKESSVTGDPLKA